MSVTEEIKALFELKQAGVLTEEEFQQQKSQLLSGGSPSAAVAPAPMAAPNPTNTNHAALMQQAQTHAQVGNVSAAISHLDQILASEPNNFEALSSKASFSRKLFPDFNGTNHEYIIALAVDRISPAMGYYSIALQFCPAEGKEEYITQASNELLQYAVNIAAEDVKFSAGKTLKAEFGGSDVDKKVARKAEQQAKVHVSSMVATANVVYQWGGMTSALAKPVAVLISRGKKIPEQVELYNRIIQDFPELQLKEQGCFPADAKVSVMGGAVPIASIQVGDQVLTIDSNGNPNYQFVTRTLCHNPQPIERLLFDDGTVLRTTSNHTVKTDKGWRKVSKIECGMGIVTADGKSRRLVRKDTQAAEPVFNLYTANDHTFVVNGCVVHNFTHLRAIRTILSRLLVDPIVCGKATKRLQQSSKC